MMQRERLIELILNSGVIEQFFDYEMQEAERLADYLLENGVIVLPEIKDGMCFDEFLYETDKIITEYYCKKNRTGGLTMKWISVDDALPEVPFACLLIVWDSHSWGGDDFLNYLPYFAGWDGARWNDGDGEEVPFEVAYWLPIPQIPKEDGK